MIPFLSFEPDKGEFSATSTDAVLNVLPLLNGWGPMPSLTDISASLGAQCFGAVWFRGTTGTYGFIAGTATGLFKLTSSGTWTSVSRLAGGAYNLAAGHFWQFEIFGTGLYATHLNDALQVLDVDSGTNFAAAPGSPPQAKFIRTIGDFLFLAHLKVGADVLPRSWHNSAINDASGWTVGTDSSDSQEIADGGEIVGLIPMTGGARVIQQTAKRALIFAPGSAFPFQSTDIDATHGSSSPYAIVPLGSGGYFYINETGFYLNDNHQAIGAERVDDYFFADIDLSKLGEVQAIADPFQKIVWLTYQDQSGIRKMLGYNWQIDRWTRSDVAAECLVSAVTAGQVIDDITDIVDTMDIPVDSPAFQGGTKTFGAFTSSDKLSLFAGDSAAAVVETATTELIPDGGAFVSGAKLKGNPTNYTMQVGKGTLPDDVLTWSSANMRSSRTGMVPFRSDGKYHRFRANIASGGDWSHLHGVTPMFIPSGDA